MASTERATCLIYLPATYSGRGVPEICMSLARSFPTSDLDVTIFLPRARKELPSGIHFEYTMMIPFRYLPWRYGQRTVIWSHERKFRRAIDHANPRRTVAYFWPSPLGAPTAEMIAHVQRRGITTVREMVNTACTMSGPILDALYAKHGLPLHHNIHPGLVAFERDELPRHDRLFAPNAEVERSLLELGIPPERILPTSYGWNESRFRRDVTVDRSGPFRAIFVGLVGVRKGILELLDAWERAGVSGELLLVGEADTLIEDRLQHAVASGTVRHLPYSDDIAGLYATADIFVFPSHEEGGPQVTYEAAACGLPIITTPMGAGRLVENLETGLIVPAGDVASLADAIRRLASSADLRARLGTAARAAAEQFEYSVIGARRAETLRLLALHEV